MEDDRKLFVSEAKIGEEAPLFEMDAVLPKKEGLDRLGIINMDKLLNEGKWIVLYFYPLDFTFVCPTEIKRFNELYPKFKELGAEVIAVSTDSTYSHLAWQEQELGKLQHPHASDKAQYVSESYGVLDIEKGISSRATFIIAPNG